MDMEEILKHCECFACGSVGGKIGPNAHKIAGEESFKDVGEQIDGKPIVVCKVCELYGTVTKLEKPIVKGDIKIVYKTKPLTQEQAIRLAYSVEKKKSPTLQGKPLEEAVFVRYEEIEGGNGGYLRPDRPYAKMDIPTARVSARKTVVAKVREFEGKHA